MCIKHIRAFIFLLVLSAAGFAQTATPTPISEEKDVVKITSELVQLDAIVTDKDGNQVKDLKAEDFQILQDGKPQKITYLSYINTDSPAKPAAGVTREGNKNITVLPPASRSTVTNPGRLLTFVVDDGNCSASNIGMKASREALEKFVLEQMLPNDRVAIYHTRAGSSVFQQYTSDKTRLLQIARKVRWYPPTGACATSDGSFYDAAKSNTFETMSSSGSKTITIESPDEKKVREASEDFSRSNQVVGTLGVLRYIIRGLDQAGGRKVVFLLSDGLPFRARDGRTLDAIDVLRELTDLANRSSVVFNTVDVRGLFSTSVIEARDFISTRDDAAATERTVADRTRDVRNSQDGLSFLADETGGQFSHSQNFLDVPIGRALNLERGYYLIAYEPDNETFKGKKFNKIEIKSNRPELKIQSRSGFLAAVTPRAKVKNRTGETDLYEAIVAPLPTAGLDLQLTAFFGNSPEKGNFVRSLTHVDGDEITLVDDGVGFKKATFDVVAVTLNEKNEKVDDFNRTHSVKVEAAAMPLIKKNGLIYITDVPIKKAGTYNFRVAIRDANSKMIGSAGQIVQIPDLKKGDLVLSALTVSDVDAQGKFTIPTASTPENAISITVTEAVPAIRRFRRGTVVAFAYTIYNAKLPPGAEKPNLSIQMNFYANGTLVSEGKPMPADLQKQPDWSRINDYTYMQLKPQLEPGDYAMQIIVTDLAGGKKQVSSQFIDFEITQ